MVLQLHVWGPAFGLPSLDAECLAAIAYLAQTTSPTDYQLIQSSPSAVPTRTLHPIRAAMSAARHILGCPAWMRTPSPRRRRLKRAGV
ncbi:hypothetical protein N0V88_006521 [Collariella sp. IMI 366227]|nr:hypothetical protein N0V88_006521 [Collariella sp. IMI 366227]